MSSDLEQFLNAFADVLAVKVAEKLARTTSENLNELLTVAQVAEELNRSESFVRTLISAGTLARPADIREMCVSRRELERYTTGRAK